jgi:hypothetical protein
MPIHAWDSPAGRELGTVFDQVIAIMSPRKRLWG